MQAHWTVPADHPAFAGHFPGRPIVPGVVLVDRAILFASQLQDCPAEGLRLVGAKFLSPVGPGEELQFSFHTTPTGALQFSIRAGDREVASGSLNFRRE